MSGVKRIEAGEYKIIECGYNVHVEEENNIKHKVIE